MRKSGEVPVETAGFLPPFLNLIELILGLTVVAIIAALVFGRMP